MKYSGIQLKNCNEISMKSPLRCLSQKCFYYRFGALGLSLGYLIKVVATSQFCPKEILLGLVVNTSKTPMEVSNSFLPPSEIDMHMAYSAQQWLDGYAEAVHHAIRRKATFDRKVLKSKAGVVKFKNGQLVQVFRDNLASTLRTERKLAPLWSPPR
jgi:hypothetical protein